MFKNKRLWRYVLFGFIWLITLGGLVVLMSFIEVKKSAMVCTKVNVIIPGSEFFIDKQEVDNIIGLNSNSLVGRRLENINLNALEARLKDNPFVENASVYSDMDGVIEVEISQRRPMMRMMNMNGQDFYVDQHGMKVPLSANFTVKVLAANGYIEEMFANRIDTLRTPLAKELFKTADFIRRDSLWSAQIAQIYVNEQHEMELIPRVGNQRILLGNADSLDVKFRNLLAFYKQAIPLVGWAAYKAINIKYTNQIVGVKNDNLKHDTATVKSVKKDSTLTLANKDTTNTSTVKPVGTVAANKTPAQTKPVGAATVNKTPAQAKPTGAVTTNKPATPSTSTADINKEKATIASKIMADINKRKTIDDAKKAPAKPKENKN